MNIASFYRKAFLLFSLAMCFGSALSFAGSIEKMTIPELLSEFDKTDSKEQRVLANRTYLSSNRAAAKKPIINPREEK